MTLTQKLTKATAAAATAEDILQSEHESVLSAEEEKEDNKDLER